MNQQSIHESAINLWISIQSMNKLSINESSINESANNKLIRYPINESAHSFILKIKSLAKFFTSSFF